MYIIFSKFQQRFLRKKNFDLLLCSIDSLEPLRGKTFQKKKSLNFNNITKIELDNLLGRFFAKDQLSLKFKIRFILEKSFFDNLAFNKKVETLFTQKSNNLLLKKYLSKFKFLYFSHFNNSYFDDNVLLTEKELNTLALMLIYKQDLN